MHNQDTGISGLALCCHLNKSDTCPHLIFLICQMGVGLFYLPSVLKWFNGDASNETIYVKMRSISFQKPKVVVLNIKIQ